VLAAGSAALVIGWLSLRATGVYFIMVTLAFTQMLFYLFNDSPALGGSDGLYVAQRPVDSRLAAYAAIWAATILVYLLLARILRAPYGRTLEGIRDNEQRMRSLGYATRRYKLVAFVIAGALAGLAGYLDVTLYGFVNPAQLRMEAIRPGSGHRPARRKGDLVRSRAGGAPARVHRALRRERDGALERVDRRAGDRRCALPSPRPGRPGAGERPWLTLSSRRRA